MKCNWHEGYASVVQLLAAVRGKYLYSLGKFKPVTVDYIYVNTILCYEISLTLNIGIFL